MEAFESENALLDAFVEAVRALDPDILVGFEVQQGSLGYLVERASTLERKDPLLRQLSRTPQACDKQNLLPSFRPSWASKVFLSTPRWL